MSLVHCFNTATGKPFTVTEKGYELLMASPTMAKIITRLGPLGENKPVKEFVAKVDLTDEPEIKSVPLGKGQKEIAESFVEKNLDQKFNDLLEVAGIHLENKQYLLAQDLYTQALLLSPRDKSIIKVLDKIKTLLDEQHSS